MKTNPDIVLGFDFGMKHIGIAAGQQISRTATPIISLQAKNGIPNWDEVAALIDEWHPFAFIVGLPLNMDGTTQPIAIAAQAFANSLAANYGLPVYMADERLSTWEAKTQLKLHKPQLNKQELAKINALSAVILTEQWLHTNN